MEARSITLEALESHFNRIRAEDPSLFPINGLRVASYLNNPRAQPSDHVLFEMREGTKLIAYRTLLPDVFFDADGGKHRFAWLSGNYVVPEYRRKGISTRLLQLAEARWEGNLMYTNYAPASRALYDQTGQFRLLARREGSRFYLRAASADLLQGRMRLGGTELLRLGDRLANQLVESRLKRFVPTSSDACAITRITSFDPSLQHLMAETLERSLFKRDAETFHWILDFPWVSAEQGSTLPYHFSYKAEQFENMLFKFELEGQEGLGLLWLLLHDRKILAPYLFLNHEDILPHMAGTFIETMIARNGAYATVRHPGLSAALRSMRKWFLTIRNMPQFIFVHKSLADKVPQEHTFQDGDGDVVFTG